MSAVPPVPVAADHEHDPIECGCELTPEDAPVPVAASAPEVWSGAVAPGGYVCGALDPTRPDGICGMPVESEPCSEHNPETPGTAEPDGGTR